MTMEDGKPPKLLPCGHFPRIDYDVDDHMSNRYDGGREILDYCDQCDWESPYRKQATAVNNAAAERGESDTELVKWVHESRVGEIGFDNDAMTKLFELAIRSSLRYGREEALRERLKEMSQ